MTPFELDLMKKPQKTPFNLLCVWFFSFNLALFGQKMFHTHDPQLVDLAVSACFFVSRETFYTEFVVLGGLFAVILGHCVRLCVILAKNR